MSYSLYSLDVISHLPEFEGRTLKKHGIEGVDTIGVWGNEPFEVIFRNNSYQTVQVKLSIDGTDLLTGTTATTASMGDMWMVKPYSKLALKAWPETSKGGAQFIFTSAEKSVAVNTHGNLNSRGVIAAAVFTESYVAPYTVYGGNGTFTLGSSGRLDVPKGSSAGNYGDHIKLNSTMDYLNIDLERGIADDDLGEVGPAAAAATFDKQILSEEKSSGRIDGRRNARERKKELKSLAAVGAGQHIEQRLETVEGFVKPRLAETVQIRFLWWDDLVAEIKEQHKNVSSGFPGDEVKIMSLGTTPRLNGKNRVHAKEIELSRF